MIEFRNILIPTDFSANSSRALPYAVELVQRYGGKLTVVHVSPPEGFVTYGFKTIPVPAAVTEQVAETVATGFAKLQEEVGDQVELDTRHLHSATPWKALVELADTEPFDLIVIATHGASGIQRVLLGSTAENVVRHAICPVLSVRCA